MACVQAWTDESTSQGATGFCVVVTVSNEINLDDLRTSLRSLVFRGKQLLHWRDDRDTAQSDATLALINANSVDATPRSCRHCESQRDPDNGIGRDGGSKDGSDFVCRWRLDLTAAHQWQRGIHRRIRCKP